MVIKKTFITLVSGLIFISSTFSQLKFNDLSSFKLGENFLFLKNDILKRFDKVDREFYIYKCNSLNRHKIEFPRYGFDYYGRADYSFCFIKDTLSHIEIEFRFKPDGYGFSDFENLIRVFIDDMNNNFPGLSSKKISPENIYNFISLAKRICKPQTSLADVTDLTNDEYNLQNSINLNWNLKNLDMQDRYLIFEPELQKGETQFYDNKGYREGFTGRWMKLKLTLFDKKTKTMLDLYNNSSYSCRTEQYFSDNKLVTIDDNGVKIVANSENIPLKTENGIYKLPVTLNNVLSLDFVLDPGAADLSISPDVFLVLLKSGTISDNDFIGTESYQFADGSIAKSNVINLKSLIIGGKEIKNVRMSISKSVDSPLLLGQSALKNLNNYKIDVKNQILVID